MKQLENLSENENYTAVNLGSFDELMDYNLIHPDHVQFYISPKRIEK